MWSYLATSTLLHSPQRGKIYISRHYHHYIPKSILNFENDHNHIIRKPGAISIPTKAPIAQKLVPPAPTAFAELLKTTDTEVELEEVDAFDDDVEEVVDSSEKVCPIPASELVVDCPISDPVFTFEVEVGIELWVEPGTAGLVPTGTGFVRTAGVGSERVCERELNDAAAAAELVS